MRKLIFAFLFATLPLLLSAQHFTAAPQVERPVKEIIEWTTYTEDEKYEEETLKETVYQFRRDGQLANIQFNDTDQEERSYTYDAKGRLTEVRIRTNSKEVRMTYRYQPGLKVAEIKEDDLYLKNMQYMDKQGQVVEEKEYERFNGDQIRLISRKVFNYNDRGDLFGEMIYLYGPKGAVTFKKSVHTFDRETHLKSKSLFYDAQGNPEQVLLYSYDEKGRLTNEEWKNLQTKDWEKTNYLYKNGKLWQVITSARNGSKFVKVYKDGRYIRYKEFLDDQLEWFTDFQYVYY